MIFSAMNYIAKVGQFLNREVWQSFLKLADSGHDIDCNSK